MKIQYLTPPPANEMLAFDAANRRILRWSDEFDNINAQVYPSVRNAKTGWLEWLIVIRDSDGKHQITIGMVERGFDAGFEFHS
jgi:hypothetical protein